jgi:predicted nucleic acid-binding protein
LDDRRARSVARRIGIAVIGTVGVLVRAKHSGILASLKPLLEDLERRGFFLSASLKKGSSEKIVG